MPFRPGTYETLAEGRLRVLPAQPLEDSDEDVQAQERRSDSSGFSDDDDVEDIDDVLQRFVQVSSAPSREVHLLTQEGRIPLWLWRLRSIRSVPLISALVLGLVTSSALWAGIFRSDHSSSHLGGAAGRPLSAFQNEAARTRNLSWTAYDQFQFPGLETLESKADTTVEDAMAFAQRHEYEAFVFDKAKNTAAFKKDFNSIWDVKIRGPLLKSDLKYLGYWSPEVLYIRKGALKPCQFPAIMCGMGFATAKVAYCPPDFCLVNECCTTVTPVTPAPPILAGTPSSMSSLTTSARATSTTATTRTGTSSSSSRSTTTLSSTSTTTLSSTSTTTLELTTTSSTASEASASADVNPEASTTSRTTATQTTTTRTMTTTSTSTLITITTTPVLAQEVPHEHSRRRRSTTNGEQVESAQLDLDTEPGASCPTKFDVFRFNLSFVSGLSEEELEDAEDDFATAITNLVRDRTPDSKEVKGWGDATAKLRGASGQGGSQSRCSADVLLAVQGDSDEAIDQVRSAVEMVQSMEPAALLAELQKELAQVQASEAAGRRLGPTATAVLVGEALGLDADFEGPVAGWAPLPPRPPRFLPDGALGRSSVGASCGLVCDVEAISSQHAANAGVFEQYDNYYVYALYFAGAGVAMLIGLSVLLEFSPYQVKVTFSVLILNSDLADDGSLSDDFFEPLRLQVAQEAGAGVEAHNVKVKLLPAYSSSTGDDASKAAAARHRADMVFEAHGIETKAYSTLKVTVNPPGARHTYRARLRLVVSKSLAANVGRALEVMTGCASVLETQFRGGSCVKGNFFEVTVSERVVIGSLWANFHTSALQKCSVWVRPGAMGMAPMAEGWERKCFAQMSGVGRLEVQATDFVLEPGKYTFFVGASGGGLHTTRRWNRPEDVFSTDGTVSISCGYGTQEALVPMHGGYETRGCLWNGSLCYSLISKVVKRAEVGDTNLSPNSAARLATHCAHPCPLPCLVRAWYGKVGSEWQSGEPGKVCTAHVRKLMRTTADVIAVSPHHLGLSADPAPGAEKVLVVDRKVRAVGVVRADTQGVPLQSGDVVYLRAATTGWYMGVQKGMVKASASVPSPCHRFVLDCNGPVRSGQRIVVHAAGYDDRCLEVGECVVDTFSLGDLAGRCVPDVEASSVVRAWYGVKGQDWSEEDGQDVTEAVRKSLKGKQSFSSIATSARMGHFGEPRPGCQMEFLLDVEAACSRVTVDRQESSTPLFIANPSFSVLGHGKAICSGETACLFAKTARGPCKYLGLEGVEAVAKEGMSDGSRLRAEKEFIHLIERRSMLFRQLEGSSHIDERREEYRRSQWIFPLLLFGCVGLSLFLGLSAYTPYKNARNACWAREDDFDRKRCAPQVWEALRKFVLKVICDAAAPPFIPLPPFVMSVLVVMTALWWHCKGASEELHHHIPSREDPGLWRFEAAVKRNALMALREDVAHDQRQALFSSPQLSVRKFMRHPFRSFFVLIKIPFEISRLGCLHLVGGVQWLLGLHSCRDRIVGLLSCLWAFVKVLSRSSEFQLLFQFGLGVQCSFAASMMLFLSLTGGQGRLPAEFAWNPFKLGLELVVTICLRRLMRFPLSLAQTSGALLRYLFCAGPGEGIYDTVAVQSYLRMYASILQRVCHELVPHLPQDSAESHAYAHVMTAATNTLKWLDAYSLASKQRCGIGLYVQLSFKGALAQRQLDLERVAGELLLKAPAPTSQPTEEEVKRTVLAQERYNQKLCRTLLREKILESEAHRSLLTIALLNEELERLEHTRLQGMKLGERLRECAERREEIESSVQEILMCGSTRQVGLAPDEHACATLGLLAANAVMALILVRMLYPPVRDACDSYNQIFDSKGNPLVDVVFGAGIITFLTQLPINYEMAAHLFSVFIYEPRWRHDYVRRLRLHSVSEVHALALHGMGGFHLLNDRELLEEDNGIGLVEGDVEAGQVPFEDISWSLVVVASVFGVCSWGTRVIATMVLEDSSWAHQHLLTLCWALRVIRGATAVSALLLLVVGGWLWRWRFPARSVLDGSCDPCSCSNDPPPASSFKKNTIQACERIFCGLVVGMGSGAVIGLVLEGSEEHIANRQVPLGVVAGVVAGFVFGATGAVDQRMHLVFCALFSAGLLLGLDFGALLAIKVVLREISAKWSGTLCTRIFAFLSFAVAAVITTVRARKEHEDAIWEVVPGSARGLNPQGGNRRVSCDDPRLGIEARVGLDAEGRALLRTARALITNSMAPRGKSHFTLEQWWNCNCSLLEALKNPGSPSIASAAGSALVLGTVAGGLAGGFAFAMSSGVLALPRPLCLLFVALASLEALGEVAGELVQEPEAVIFHPTAEEIMSIEVRRKGLGWALRWMLCLADLCLEVDPALPVEPWRHDFGDAPVDGLGRPPLEDHSPQSSKADGSPGHSRELAFVDGSPQRQSPRRPKPAMETIGEP